MGRSKATDKPGLPLLQQISVAPVGFLGGGEAGVLAHGPEPAPVHGGLDPAGEGIFPGKVQILS